MVCLNQNETIMKINDKKLSFIASNTPEAECAAERLRKKYGYTAPEDADIIVALGGDGLMLQTLHQFMNTSKPIYGMNCGSVGFLMNEYLEDNLLDRMAQAEINIIHPLRMTVEKCDGQISQALAINEVSLFRQSYQAAKLKILVDNKVRMDELTCDGALVATPAGSTAYNLSAHGPILPINAHLLALTPISPFRPRRWRGALLPGAAKVRIEVLEYDKRPVSAVADHTEFRSVRSVNIEEHPSIELRMMFDCGHSLDERILSEQFQY